MLLPPSRSKLNHFRSVSHLDSAATMARKRSRKSTNTKPWHKTYTHPNLSQLLHGAIPKRMRAIEGAKARLKGARTAKAANVEYRHIQRNLRAIGDVYSKIKKHLRNG